MRSLLKNVPWIIALPILASMLISGCNGNINFLGKGAGVPLVAEPIDPSNIIDPADPSENELSPEEKAQLPVDPATGLHPMFSVMLDDVLDGWTMSAVTNDQSGYNAVTDYDGDGISNQDELLSEFTNPNVSDCPRITVRVDTPITMELRVEDNNITQNHTEVISDSDVKNTVTNSMENKQYNQLNQKTTPYVTRNSQSWSDKKAGSQGYTSSMSNDLSVKAPSTEVKNTFTTSSSQNSSFELEQSRSSMSEKTVFEDVDYLDNLNRNGSEFKDDTIERMTRNFRQSQVSKSDFVISANAGYVKAGLYLINESRNMPVRINNVIITLSFRTPSGNCLSVQTCKLKYEDGNLFDEEVYGGQELGPYTVEFENLNTYEVKKALSNGYIPQVHVVSYGMHRVEDSNYNPGVENLKIVEETAKSRTAVIKIIASGMREIYRVPAFEVDGEGNVTTGISLKKALFNIYRKRIGGGEIWEEDENEKPLTVNDTGLNWKAGYTVNTEAPGQHHFSANRTGNNWDMLGTYIKQYTVQGRDPVTGDPVTETRCLETIERIGQLKKYNPFTEEDNQAYNMNDQLTAEEFMKMKYWIILHNGRYFEGDINDPIWAGERYEIVLFDAKDFNERFKSYAYTPLMNTTGANTSSGSSDSSGGDFIDYGLIQTDNYDFMVNTLWNKEYESQSNLSRAMYLGRVVRGDVIRLDMELDEFRSLFDIDKPGGEYEPFASVATISGKIWQKFNYTFDNGEPLVEGKPGDFTYKAWPGCNQIVINIGESLNAAYYTARIWKSGETARVAKISVKNLAENNGYIIINSRTTDIDDVAFGPIDAGAYFINVYAHGIAHNVPNKTQSKTMITSVPVEDPSPAIAYPDVFSITTEGRENSLEVTINQGINSEYFMVEVTGPYNYGHGNRLVANYTPPVRRLLAHAGANTFTISKSDPSTIGHMFELTDDEKNWAVPGVFDVTAYAVNKNCLDANGDVDYAKALKLSGDDKTVMIDFNRYEEQKQCRPDLQYEKFDPKDVDLEVNFNDGSGWFSLKIGNNDDYSSDRFLDCKYTTNFQENMGRVTLYFTAPTGAGGLQNETYNVFRGGAEMVDVYLRTKALPKYQDKIWLKSSEKDFFNEADPQGYRCLNINQAINDLPNYDPLTYWLNSANNDVTTIEEFDIEEAGSRLFTSLESLIGAVDENDFGVVAPGGKSDFFFSPAKMLTYKIKVSLADLDLSNMIGEISHVDDPEYRPVGGYQSIAVTDLDTQYADYWDIYWENLSDPTKYGHSLNITANKNNTCYKILGLDPNVRYKITVNARNAISTSSPVTYIVKTLPQAVKYNQVEPPQAGNYGYGFFKDPAVPLTTDSGNLLMNGVNFAYDQALNSGSYDIWDTGVGALVDLSGYIRIVTGGQNIVDLGLTPVAKVISGIVTSPPGNQCWVDPMIGVYLLPRPVYWSRCESSNNISTAADISVNSYTPSLVVANAGPSTVSKFDGYSWGKPGCLWDDDPSEIMPFNDNYVNFMDKGTVSFWEYPLFINQATAKLRIFITDNSYIELYNGSVKFISNGDTISVPDVLDTSSWHHVYIVWDSSSGLSGGNTVKVYANGIQVISTAVPIIGQKKLKITMLAGTNIGTAALCLDNVKIWNHVVTDGTSAADWEYNGGAGNELGIHAVYGSANGYKPNLKSPNGVGFYCIPR